MKIVEIKGYGATFMSFEGLLVVVSRGCADFGWSKLIFCGIRSRLQ